MPYLPTNYYPKNCGIAIDSDTNPVAFYCLVDQYDTIERAIISIYGYLDKELKCKIYADNMGKICRIISESDYDLSNEELENWHKGYSTTNTSPWWGESGKEVLDWSIDENVFPIQGGKGEKSIIYILSNFSQGLLEKNKKYTWEIEVFSKDSNVWIVDGELDDEWKVNNNSIKIYPNNNIGVGNIFHTEIGDFQITSIDNQYWDATSKATVSEVTLSEDDTDTDELTIGELTYKNYNNFSDNNKTILPSNINDLKVQIEVYTFDYCTTKPSEISSGSDGYVIGNKIYSAKKLFTPSSNTYLYYYRQYQTIKLNSISGLESGLNYTIYSNSIKSTPNYFTTLTEPTLNIYTYNLDTRIDIKNGDTLELPNSFHQFLGENNKENPAISWYQWTVFENNIQKYQTEKIYSSTIYFEYPEFLEINYDIHFKIHYQNDYEQELKFSVIINHDSVANTTLKSFVDFNRKAIKVDYTDINSYTPIIKGQSGSLVSKDERNYLLIPENSSYEYTTIGSSQESLNFNSSWNFTCRFTEAFYGDIIKFIIDNKEYRLYYNGETDEFVFNDYGFSLYEGQNENLFGVVYKEEDGYIDSNNIKNVISGPKTIVGEYDIEYDRVFEGFSFLDLLSNLMLIVSYSYETKTLSFYFENQNDKTKTVTKTVNMNFGNNLSSIEFFSNVYWDSFYLEDIEKNKYQFSVIFSTGNLNGGDFVTPQGFVNYKYFIYRYNLSKEKELLDYNYVCELPLISDNVILGFYDYGVGGDNTYEYIIVPIYKKNNEDIYYAGAKVRSDSVTTDWFEVGLFGTKEENKNTYLIDEMQKWYFELDVSADQITFNSDIKIHNLNSAIPKIGLSNKNYLSNSITCKLGKIKNECEYVEDNIKYLSKFNEFSNSNKIKILRLKNGLIIPVNISLKSASFNNNVVGTPSDISFDWTQIADYKNVSLYEYLYKGDD